MLLRCIKSFETREGGVARTIDEGTVWYKVCHDTARGGYELVIMQPVEDGRFVQTFVTVRLEKVMDQTLFKAVPPDECATPIGCSEYFHEWR